MIAAGSNWPTIFRDHLGGRSAPRLILEMDGSAADRGQRDEARQSSCVCLKMSHDLQVKSVLLVLRHEIVCPRPHARTGSSTSVEMASLVCVVSGPDGD